MRISEEVKKFLRMIGDDTAPKLSDLVEMWLKENVNDPEVVAIYPAAPMAYYAETEKDAKIVKLNGINIAYVYDTYAVIKLRAINVSFVSETYGRDEFVAAADPEMFEKLWNHVATLDEGINCPGFSLIDKTKIPPGGAKKEEQGYPAFLNGEN
jgi:hypothetical protein